jgi:hypothetical protein
MPLHRYNSKGEIETRRSSIDCQQAIKDGEKVLVEQSHKKEVEINNIVRKHGEDLIRQVASLQEFVYDDVTGNDFQESMNALLRASEAFENVPSEIRKEFDHSPAKFMDFVHNPENKEKMIEMGLAKAPEVEVPLEVKVVNQTPTTPAE